MSDEITNVEENTELDGEIVYNEPPAEGDAYDDGEPIEGTEEVYEPNLTYKIKDEEHTFDEMFSGAINSKEAEDKLRDLYTRAGGLDSYKEKVTDYESRFLEQDDQINKYRNGFETLAKYRDDGDLRRLFGSLKVDDETVMKYALEVAREQELPEEQRIVIKQNREYEDRLNNLETQLNSHRQNNYQAETERDLNELNGYVEANKELNEAMASMGYNLGNEIIMHGLSSRTADGKEPSIAEATKAVVEKYNKILSFHKPVENQAPVEDNGQQLQQRINNRPNTLPTVNSTNQTAPMDRHLTIDELRKLGATFT